MIPANRLYASRHRAAELLPDAERDQLLRPAPGAGGCIKGYDYQSQMSDQYPRREDLARIDYNVTSKLRVFGHYPEQQQHLSRRITAVAGRSNVPIDADHVANPGYAWGVGTHLRVWPDHDQRIQHGCEPQQLS